MIPERVTWWLAGTTAEQCYASSFTVLRPGENRYAITVALQKGGGKKPKNYILKRRVGPSLVRFSTAAATYGIRVHATNVYRTV